MKEIKFPGQDWAKHGVGGVNYTEEAQRLRRAGCLSPARMCVCVCVCVCMRAWGAHMCGDPHSAVQALAARHGAARPGGRQAQSPQLLSVTAPPCSLSDYELCDV